MDYKTRQQKLNTENTTLTNALAELGGSVDPGPEWNAILALLRGGWPGNLSDSEALSWPALLSDVPTVDVARVVRELHQQGTKYRPRPSEARAQLAPETGPNELRAGTPPPAFDVAWSYIARAGVRSLYRVTNGDHWLDAHAHPAVVAWSRIRGLRSLWHLPVNDPDRGGLIRRDLRTDYTAYTRDWADSGLRHSSQRLAIANAPSNQQTNRTLGKVNPLSALPSPPDLAA